MGNKAPTLKRHHIAIATVLATLTAILILLIVWFLAFHGRIYPGLYALGVPIGGLTTNEAAKTLQSLQLPETLRVELKHNGATYTHTIATKDIGASVDYHKTAINAYLAPRSGGAAFSIYSFAKGVFVPRQIELEVYYSSELVEAELATLSSLLPEKPLNPSLILQDEKVVLVNGKAGPLINPATFARRLSDTLKKLEGTMYYEADTVDPTLDGVQAEVFVARGQSLVGKTLELVTNKHSFVYDDGALVSTVGPHGGFLLNSMAPGVDEIYDTVYTPPVNPVFVFADGRVQEFSPAASGVEVDKRELYLAITSALQQLETSSDDSLTVEIPTTTTMPDIATGDINDLGINELIGTGRSSFKGSIASRIHNVALAASKLNGVLIPPGEVFSFNGALGEISGNTGYRQAYIIQGDRTVLGDGGGVCQVSTTFFRAALASGLPIVEWRPHSYRVSYYEQDSPPGIDATIYSPSVDLKIKNDTPGHILIQAFTDTRNLTLVFEFYGTSDGRTPEISTPVVTGVTPPPDDLYIDDPTLPEGEVRQIDYKAWGARTTFNYKVVRDGETLHERTFNANYRPWQAKFLRGVGQP